LPTRALLGRATDKYGAVSGRAVADLAERLASRSSSEASRAGINGQLSAPQAARRLLMLAVAWLPTRALGGSATDKYGAPSAQAVAGLAGRLASRSSREASRAYINGRLSASEAAKRLLVLAAGWLPTRALGGRATDKYGALSARAEVAELAERTGSEKVRGAVRFDINGQLSAHEAVKGLLMLGAGVALAGPASAVDIARAVIPAPAAGVNHGAAIAEMRSGALLVCWYSGAHEEDRSVRILCSRGAPDGSAWSAPWTAVGPGYRATGAAALAKSLGNVTLTAAPDGRVWMIYGVIQSRVVPILGETCKSWSCGRIDARVSADEGRSWSPARRLVDIEGALPRAELRPDGGRWLAPAYEEGPQRSLIVSVSLTGETAVLRGYWRLNGWKVIQPALVPQNDGRYRVYFRDQAKRGVWTARFDPRTGAWTGVALTNLPNPGAAVDAFADGKGAYVVIYNPSSTTRDALALARSADGVYFTPGCRLSGPGDGGAAYPSVIRGRDQAWRVVYTSGAKAGIRFVRFTSAWLEKCFAR
jgi:hypothetical protein